MRNRSIHRLKTQLGELDALVARGTAELGIRVASVSGWSVGEQIDHALQVMTTQLSHVTKRREIPGNINLLGRLMLAHGWLPRGVIQAPQGARPKDSSVSALRAALAKARGLLSRIEADPEAARFRWPVSQHPRFGQLNAPRCLRFAAMHTHHHLKIVHDLEAAAARSR